MVRPSAHCLVGQVLRDSNRYATSSLLNLFSPLLQSFWNTECAPYPAVHLTLDPSTLTFRTYSSSPIGLNPSSPNLLFKPVPSSLSIPSAERTGIEFLARPLLGDPSVPSGAAAAGSTTAPGAAAAANSAVDGPVGTERPMEHLYALLLRLRTMLGQVAGYVEEVVEGKKEGDAQVGKYLFETVGSIPLDKAGSRGVEEDFQSHLSVRPPSSSSRDCRSFRIHRTCSWCPTSPTWSGPSPRSRAGSTCSSRHPLKKPPTSNARARVT